MSAVLYGKQGRKPDRPNLKAQVRDRPLRDTTQKDNESVRFSYADDTKGEGRGGMGEMDIAEGCEARSSGVLYIHLVRRRGAESQWLGRREGRTAGAWRVKLVRGILQCKL
jgi:hypothetical protein